jgi:cytochrome bd ubiquinol oxidase subunit II
MPDLATVWFVLLAALFGGYALLDGFDLGAGIVHLYVARSDDERRQVMGAIGPVWDGNEVWLITAGGATFAAFPVVYGTVLSGFYLAVMLILGALILRAISIEYRDKETSPLWRRGWDLGFFLGSTLVAFLFGVALGNLLAGLSLAGGVYHGGFVGLLRPFPLVVGALAVALAVQQGSAWLVMKTTGDLAARARRTQLVAQVAVVVLWLAATVLAFAGSLPAVSNFRTNVAAWVGPVLVANAVFFGFRATMMGQQ